MGDFEEADIPEQLTQVASDLKSSRRDGIPFSPRSRVHCSVFCRLVLPYLRSSR